MSARIDPHVSQAMLQVMRKLGETGEIKNASDIEALPPAKLAAVVDKVTRALATDGNLALQDISVDTGVAPRLSGSVLSLVNNPAELIRRMQPHLGGTNAVSAALTANALAAIDALGLSSLPTSTKADLIGALGGFVSTQAGILPPSLLGQQLLAVASRDNGFLDLAGSQVLSAFDPQMQAQLGQNFLETLTGARPEQWGRDVLGRIGPSYFNDFDPRTLGALNDRNLGPFSRDLMQNVVGLGPEAAGRELLADFTSPLRQELGQQLLAATPEALRGDFGGLLLDAMKKNPLDVGQSYLRQVGTKQLAEVGNDLFKNIPGLAGKDGSALAGGLANALLGGGDVGKNLLNVAQDFGKQKLRDLGQSMLNKYGMPLLKNVGNKALDWVKDTALGKLGKGLLDKVGGKLLDKLGGAGKIASGVLSALNGKFDTKKMLQIAMNFIPVVGPILGVLSSLPVVGKVFDVVLGGIAKVLNKIPGVGHLLKGVGKVVNFVGKGVKKVGKFIGKGLKKVGKGIKKVGKAIGNGVKSVGKAIGKGIKKIFSGW